MKNLIGFLILFLITGCATSPQLVDTNLKQGSWEAKAQVRDLVKDKTDRITLDFVAVGADAIRMDVSGTLGVSLAHLVLRKDQVAYLLPQKKIYVSGRASEKAFEHLLGISVQPTLLYNILFDEPIADKNWTCTTDQNNKVLDCLQLASQLKISWSERDGEKKKVTVQSKEFELVVIFKNFTTKVQDTHSIFTLTVPAGFKRYKLP